MRKLEITGVVLAGGESRRMGRNKALLEIEGRSLLERSLDVLNRVFREVIISSRDSEIYAGLSFPVIEDRVKGRGPLGGLYSVLPAAKYDYVFLAACDMPFLNEEVIRYLYRKVEDYDAVVPQVLDTLHPLHAYYHKRIFDLVEQNIRRERLKIRDILSECRTKYVSFGEEYARTFVNLNSPQDWENFRDKWSNNLKKPE